jgi:hypothetical protein
MTMFGGANSVGLPMSGMVYERGYAFGGLDVGWVGGGYEQNDYAWRQKTQTNQVVSVVSNNYETFTTTKTTTYEPFRLFEINGIGFVPIVGGAINYRVSLSKTTYIKLNNIISPVITNTSLAFGWNF